LNKFKAAAREYDLGGNSKYRIAEVEGDKWIKKLQNLADQEEEGTSEQDF
jgi:hypothetical protein